jgi:hypothetical protein
LQVGTDISDNISVLPLCVKELLPTYLGLKKLLSPPFSGLKELLPPCLGLKKLLPPIFRAEETAAPYLQG